MQTPYREPFVSRFEPHPCIARFHQKQAVEILEIKNKEVKSKYEKYLAAQKREVLIINVLSAATVVAFCAYHLHDAFKRN